MPFINLNKVTEIAEEAKKLNFTELLDLQDTINRMVNKQAKKKLEELRQPRTTSSGEILFRLS